MNAAEVRARIASLVLENAHASDLGAFTLRPVQQRTLSAVRAALNEFGGALLADPPGTGKTVLALAAARGTSRVLVLAPSTLREQWLSAADRAAVPITFVSIEALSRNGTRAVADFVIIDEAHHLRTRTTRRYHHASALCVGAQVLLLSATPVVNLAADRDALLALFMGSRAEHLSPAELGRCVVRRRDSGATHPALRRLGAITAHAEIEGIAESLRQLPPPIAIAGGAAATALIAMTLAMAWQSSLAALDAALRRREQRGGALADLLRAGRRPTHAALRYWVLSDDTTQLALPLLVSPAAEPPGPATVDALLTTLERHLAAVAALRALIRPHRADDTASRAAALRTLLAAHPCSRVIVFARHAETVRTLYSALRREPGVMAIVGARVHAAAGRWTRDEVLRAIGPRARAHAEHDARDPHDPLDPRAIRLVLSTDALAEGVEMQGVGVVVHADLPWTPARLEQRVGRVVRVGSTAREVYEAWFAAPRGARELVRLGARLARKEQCRRLAVREGDARGEIVAILESWSGAVTARDDGAAPQNGAARGDGCAVRGAAATSFAACDGFVSVLIEREGARLLCGVHDGSRWRLSSTPRRVLSVLRSVLESEPGMAELHSPREAQGAPIASGALTVRRVRRLLARVLARRGALQLAGSTRGDPTHSASERRIKRVRGRLARLLERAPALARPVLAERHEHLMRVLWLPLEAAREGRIDDLLGADLDDATFARRLGALLLDRPGRGSPGDEPRSARDQARTAPILLLRRASAPTATPATVPPSASPGSAATR